ncbi:MAG: glutamate--cysteine ligase [Jiangellaceae bacterium]|nr:glutamate--cysteine ligase [Jiangellaceae bacterium]
MGRDIEVTEFTREDRLRYREKVKANLAALRTLVDSGAFETGRRTCGVEMEVYITDPAGKPAPINAKLLERIASHEFQTELAQFNIEFHVPPRLLTGHVFHTIESELRRSLNHAHDTAEALGANVMIIGILPTVTDLDFTEQFMSANPRYKALNDMMLAARGEDILIRIDGADVLQTRTSSILYEAACTSMQLHLQVDPHDFGLYWNAAQLLSAPLVAVGANSPFFLGKQLHHETRITLFEQAADTRTEELALQGVRPRVWFGEKWLDEGEGLWDLFDENVRYFPALLPICEDEDPAQMLDAGKVPTLPELTLHNGTIYRWNRPVYEVVRGRPHMRIENRVLPAGPSVPDSVANAAFYYGALHGLVSRPRPYLWEQISFSTARDNFYTAARQGLGARLYWPRVGASVPVSELILRHLLPLARDGLIEWGVDAGDVDFYLGIIEERTLSGVSGAGWQMASWRTLVDSGRDREQAFAELVRLYQQRSYASTPVHTWPVGG